MAKMTKRKLSNKVTKLEKGKSEAKNHQIASALKIVRKLIAKEAVDYALKKRRSMPIAKIMFSDAERALKKLKKG
jgi:hypothetical protein